MTGASVLLEQSQSTDLPSYFGTDAGLRFPSRFAVECAAAMVDASPTWISPTYGTLTTWLVRVGPGVIRVASQTVGAGPADPQDRLTSCEGCPFVTSTAPKRGRIYAWSRKSRANMVRTMTELDWQPVVDAGPGWRPAMVTLTLPGDWLAIAPDAKTWGRLLDAFRKRWERKWGEPIRGVWKKEFQRRGAPHLHLYCAVPTAREFYDWLSRTWFEVCGSGDERHLLAGTGVDWREGIRAADPKRLGVYFAKRASAHNTAGSKEYQHFVPSEWMANGGGGRFWGYWKMEKATAEVELDRHQFVALKRLMRRHLYSQGRTVTSRRRRVDTETGEVTPGRKVTRRYRVRSMHGHGGGFVLYNDAPAWLVQAVRWSELSAGG